MSEGKATSWEPGKGIRASGHPGTKNDGDRPDDFRCIGLWKEAQELAAEVGALVVSLLRNAETGVIGAQILRSAGSVPANIAEGFGRFSQPAYRNHLSIARGSLFETESWLDLLQRRGYVTDERAAPILLGVHALGRLLTVRMKSLDSNKTYAVREEGEPDVS